LQIGQMLDIDLLSEHPPTPPPPRCMYPKCGNLCGQRDRKRFKASWGLRMSHICPCNPCPSPQRYRSKVESHHFAHQCWYSASALGGNYSLVPVLLEKSGAAHHRMNTIARKNEKNLTKVSDKVQKTI
jgi:hypothetical protein